MKEAFVKFGSTTSRTSCFAPLAILVTIGCTMPSLSARAATNLHCTAPMSELIVNPDASLVAVLGACTPNVDLLPTPQLRVGAVQDGTHLVSHDLGPRKAFLGEFTANDRLLWFSAVDPSTNKDSRTLRIYERDLRSDKDRIVTSVTTPFPVARARHMQGSIFSLIVTDNQATEFERKVYIYKNEKLYSVQPVDGDLRPLYWSESNKAFMCTVTDGGYRGTVAHFALLTADGQLHRLQENPGSEQVSARSMSGALVQYSPRSSLAIAIFVRFRPSSFGSSATGLVSTAIRDGRVEVAAIKTNEKNERPFNAMISKTGKYIALKFSNYIDIIRLSDNNRIVRLPQTPAMQSGSFVFSDDEKKIVVTDGDMIFIRQLGE